MSEIKLPPLTDRPLIFVDATPDSDYPLRILRAHRHNTDCRWKKTGDSEPGIDRVIKAMNETATKRARLLDDAISILEAAALDECFRAEQPEGQPDIAPCPWCGETATADPGCGSTWHIQCDATACLASGPDRDTQAEAIAAWNKVARGEKWQAGRIREREATIERLKGQKAELDSGLKQAQLLGIKHVNRLGRLRDAMIGARDTLNEILKRP